jgi:hypothetical protein
MRAGIPLFVPALILAVAIILPAAVGAQATTPHLPVRIGEAKVDNEHGVTSSDCVLVMPDGRFRLERTRQVLPSSKATLRVFESSLGSSEFLQLRGIVENEGAGEFPEYDKQPVFFQNAPWFSSVTVDVGEGGIFRKLGYWAWDGRNAGPGVPADVEQRWRRSEAALRPLIEWFHRIEAVKLSPSGAAPTQCSLSEP